MPSSPEQIQIDVETQYLADRLPKEEDKFAFAYHIAIHNHGADAVTLLNRYWLITDGNGKKTEVKGPGVVGEQPTIKAGESYRYTSGAILDTPFGTMEGYYEMKDGSGDLFRAAIPVFGLSTPNLIN
ncbi:Co2+/Mg2+ efflux protein ApaG [Aestuariibacter halophilus]|uniref:Protein ApaG n=1 Tax=Fluctibacter halophilus TaxID=226011 RepID=A0ABS8GC40_9ALTE|nr:Co2+/Mg2+ efflux protein ApaG [Aestuariibacter halophilus]MCC2617816.1 Co2+/Mg2+ efflux protein ApaG [Aestuariibacter halophilus]